MGLGQSSQRRWQASSTDDSWEFVEALGKGQEEERGHIDKLRPDATSAAAVVWRAAPSTARSTHADGADSKQKAAAQDERLRYKRLGHSWPPMSFAAASPRTKTDPGHFGGSRNARRRDLDVVHDNISVQE